MARKCLLLSSLALLFLGGCGLQFKNLTPEKIPQNASDTYTLSFELENKPIRLKEGTFKAGVMIDGIYREMQSDKSAKDACRFSYDYRLPAGCSKASFYFLINYIGGRSKAQKFEIKSQLYSFELMNRYVLALDSNRGPIGTKVSLMGRGFNPEDKVFIGYVPAETVFISDHHLQFKVPAIPPNQTYSVTVASKGIYKDEGQLAGDFFVDAIRLQVSPKTLNIKVGQQKTLKIVVGADTLDQGLKIQTYTNIPDALIVDDISFEPGVKETTVQVEGSQAGTGKLFFCASGCEETSIDINVISDLLVEEQEMNE